MGYKCADCEDEFEEESDLGIHVLVDLSTECVDGWKCDICGWTCEEESDMEMHLMWAEGKAIRTGKTKKSWDEFMNNPDFDEIRKEIDNHSQGE